MSDILKLMVSVGGQVDPSLKRTKKDVADLEKDIDDINKKGIHPKVDPKATKGVKDLTKNTDKLKDSMGDLKEKGMDAVSGSTGSFGMELIKLGKNFGPVGIAISVAAAALTAFGIKMTELADKNRKLRLELASGYGSKEQAVAVTSKFKTIVQQFGVGEDSLKKNVAALVANYNISAEEALDVINDTLIATKGRGAERLDDFAKYAARFSQIGISIDEQQRLLVEGLNKGIAEDKLMDFFKGGADAVLDMSDEVSASLDQLGIDSKQLKKDLASGKTTAYEAEKKILDLATKRLNNTEKQIFLAKVFGGVVAEVNTDTINSLVQENKSVKDIIESRKEELESIKEKNELLLETEKNYDKAALAFEGLAKYWEKMKGQIGLGVSELVSQVGSSLAAIIKILITVLDTAITSFQLIFAAMRDSIATTYNALSKLSSKVGFDIGTMETGESRSLFTGFMDRMEDLWSGADLGQTTEKGNGSSGTFDDLNKSNILANDNQQTKSAADASVNGVTRVTSETKSIIFNIDNLVKIDQQNIDTEMDIKEFEKQLTNTLISAINNSQTQF